MDMFMDKLAQKLTAQEIIKANTAADVEELNKLKNQIAEYNECLAKLQKLIDDGFAKLSGVRTKEDETVRLAEENLGSMKALQQEVESLKELVEQQHAGLDMLDKSAAHQIEAMSVSVSGRIKSMTEQTQTLAETVTEKIDQLCGQLEAQATGGLTDRLDLIEENVHKECVKVYRNVQAVMVEESGKQSEALAETKMTVSSLKRKLGAVLGVSVAAAALSLAGLLFQILNGLNIKLF